jgi:hypothetical protein
MAFIGHRCIEHLPAAGDEAFDAGAEDSMELGIHQRTKTAQLYGRANCLEQIHAEGAAFHAARAVSARGRTRFRLISADRRRLLAAAAATARFTSTLTGAFIILANGFSARAAAAIAGLATALRLVVIGLGAVAARRMAMCRTLGGAVNQHLLRQIRRLGGDVVENKRRHEQQEWDQ